MAINALLHFHGARHFLQGTSSIKRLEENVAATQVHLSQSDLDELDPVEPMGAAVGARYAPGMAELLNG